MTKFSISICTLAAMLMANVSNAQTSLKEGRVVYEKRTRGVIIAMGDNNYKGPEIVRKMELLFSSGQALFRELPEAEQPKAESDFKMVCYGDITDMGTWFDYNQHKKISRLETLGKLYVIDDTLPRLNWKVSGETKTIAGYTCKKAKSHLVNITKTIQLTGNGFSMGEKRDSTAIEVWFTDAIQAQGGPEYAGQAPGLIMEVALNDGNIVYTAVEVSPKVKVTDIVAPTDGIKLSAAEFKKDRDTQMENRQKLSSGNIQF